MSTRYDVWYDRRTDKHRAFRTITAAVAEAVRGPYLITERVPIGDPRIMLIEDLANGRIACDEETQERCVEAVREAKTFDFYRGRCEGPADSDREAAEE